MPPTSSADLEQFKFRHLHPQINLGTASDRYAGWVGQVYSEERYRSRLMHRTKVIGEQTFTEAEEPGRWLGCGRGVSAPAPPRSLLRLKSPARYLSFF